MKQLSLFTLIFLFVAQGLFSQIHLFPTERHGYDFNWLYKQHCGGAFCQSLGWDNTVSMGYTHAGRLRFLVGMLSESGSRIDIITPASHYFDSQISFAMLKQGIDEVPLTLTGYIGFRGARQGYFFNTGAGLYTRIKTSEAVSINPGLIVQYELDRSFRFRTGLWDFQASCDFLFNKFKVSPTIRLGDNGFRAGVGLGFVLPNLTR